jgi:hypothetical protein
MLFMPSGPLKYEAGQGEVEAASETSAVGPDVADDDPAAFEAVMRTRRVRPMSTATATYVLPDALEIPLQAVPNESQRSHWYA